MAVERKLINPQEVARVIVDNTVQHKPIAHPTGSLVVETTRIKLVEADKDTDVDLKQNFAKRGRHLNRKTARYAHERASSCACA